MKIALIGAPDSVRKIYTVLSRIYENINFIPLSREKIQDMAELAFEIEDKVQGIYLGGIGVYSAVKDRIKKPVSFVKREGSGIVKPFWEFKNTSTMNLKNLKLGIDIIDEEEFLETLREFEIKIDSYYLQKYDFQKSETDYLDTYMKQIENNEINCIFTCFGHIYYFFKEKGFPVYRIQAAAPEIKEGFRNLLNMIEMNDADKGRIGVEIIKIIKEDTFSNSILSHKMEFEKELLAYSREVEGNIQAADNDEYLIFSNKGLLNNTENIKSMTALIKEKSSERFLIGAGIGEGSTIVQAEKNARQALKLSINEGKNNIFFSNGQEIKGPLMSRREIEYKSSFDKNITKISKTAGVSSLYLEKIKSIIRKREKNIFTSRELAEFLNISERSVNRIIKKLIENKCAEEDEFESSASAGRPRRKIKFIF